MRDKTGRKLSIADIISKSLFRLQTIILELLVYNAHLIGSLPFHHIRRLFYRLMGMEIGTGSTIHMYTRFYNPSNIVIGNDSIIGEHTVLDGRDFLKIGNHVDIASQVMIYNSQHDINSENFASVEEVICKPVTIGDYVFVGPRAIILPGVTIGRGAIVGAGAVVTHDIPDFEIVGGVPAKKIGERQNKNPSYKLGRAAWFR